MDSNDYRKIASTLPTQPGIYKYLDADGNLIYVGKAKNIRKRVSSYFTRTYANSKTETMVSAAARLEFTIVNTEHDALLLENNLIKTFQPRYNVNLKDGKTYPYICIKNERFPRVFLTRKFIRDGSEYFGPYTSVTKASDLLDNIRALFPLRTCYLNLSEKNIEAKKFKICLEYHIGNCKGPCEALQSEENYNNSIQQVKNMLKGNLKPVLEYLKGLMNEHAAKYKFEQANFIKQKIDVLHEYQNHSTVVSTTIDNVDVFAFTDGEKTAFVNYMKVVNGSVIQSKTIELHKKIEEEKEELLSLAVNSLRTELESVSTEIIVPFNITLPDASLTLTVPQRGDKKKLLELAEKNVQYYKTTMTPDEDDKKPTYPERVMKQLQEDFRLKELPTHIECFDNSNFQGSYPVASMVVFKNAKPAKSEYRHFNIKTVEGPNDFASMEEIVYRRYRRLLDEGKPLPQLVIIDGGKGQLSAAVTSLEKLDLMGKLTVAGIAKRLEEIYFPGDSLPLYINKKSEGLKVIQRIRDEAHRFAITFHRKKREKGTIKSTLTTFKGIGKTSTEKLLQKFKSIEKIKNATEAEIAEVVGLSRAKKLVEELHKAVPGNPSA